MTLFLFLVILFPIHLMGQETLEPSTPRSIEELKTAIEIIMTEFKVPAVGIALVDKEGPVWIAGLGKADIEKDIDANENTMFRIGSTSKMFVALAILKLQEEGRVSLKEKVRDLIPEIWFENKWEDTNPILVEHLLEHTTGWDDWHFTDYAYSDPKPCTLLEGLNYHPHSRTSRWIPGTRMSYCNSGPPVAAYIVEKITGQKFEDYIQINFFEPLGMKNMTYYYSDVYKQLGATLYENGKPQEYWHVLMRPSGSINASPKDMAKMVWFLINRGRVNDIPLISESSLKRMETSLTTTGSKAGIEAGYGLHNYSSSHKSFVYRSHNGGVMGGLSDFSYLPGKNVGYSFCMNSGNYEAFLKISKLIRDFQTQDFEIKEVVADSELTEQHASVSGYYMPINPRSEISYFYEKLFGVQQIRCKEDSVFMMGLLGGETIKFLPANDLNYKSATTGMVNMARVNDPLAGKVVQVSEQVLKRISPVQVYGLLTVITLWLLFMLIAIVLGFIWPVLFWRGKIKGRANIRIRLWPLVASLLILIFSLLVLDANSFEKMGTISIFSVSLMLLSVGFALASVWSIVTIVKDHKVSMNRLVYWHSAILSVLHLIVTGYLLWHGVIGLRMWA